MKSKSSSLLFLAGALLAFQAHGADTAVMVQAGHSGDTEMAGAGLRLSPFWSKHWGRFKLTAHPEFQLNRHVQRRDGVPGPGGLWQAGAAAMLRLTYGEWTVRPYMELGLGAAYLTRSALGDDRFGSRLHFGEHFGVGLQVGPVFGGWRVSHFSNAGLKEPNNGLDAHQLVLGVHF